MKQQSLYELVERAIDSRAVYAPNEYPLAAITLAAFVETVKDLRDSRKSHNREPARAYLSSPLFVVHCDSINLCPDWTRQVIEGAAAMPYPTFQRVMKCSTN